MTSVRIYIAVGHGIRPNKTFDPGASGGGQTEQTAGDIVVSAAVEGLRVVGAEVKDEAYQEDPNFYGTAKAANDWSADYVIAVHHDWSGAPLGAFGHWYTHTGMTLADEILWAVKDAGFGIRELWHKHRSDLYVLKHTNAPCVLWECGRIGQYNEGQLRDMGHALARGVAKHVGLEDEMTEKQAKKFEEMYQDIKALRKSAKASSYRESIQIAQNNKDWEEAARLAQEAHDQGIVTGYRPQ